MTSREWDLAAAAAPIFSAALEVQGDAGDQVMALQQGLD